MRKNLGSKVVSALLWGLFAVSLVFLVHQLAASPTTLTLAVFRIAGVDLPLALRVDPLSTVVFAMVSLLAAVLGQYALRYLDGDERQWQFHRVLLATVSAVSFLVLASNLVMFFAAWLAISFGLHRLLLLHADRPAAVYAARKKFVVSRIGDLAIVTAIALIYSCFRTFDLAEIFARAGLAASTLTERDQSLLAVAGSLLAAGAMTKSVQVPFHFWLPETMETPAPVSALMHAGIINAGGFLVLRLSPIVTFSSAASTMLALVGALTAVYGALVMVTQNNIKAKLAYSTISQMGMMMFACGIHAYTFALFHIVAHSFYKAHAFLSTGALVEEKRHASRPPGPLAVGTTLGVIVGAYCLLLLGKSWQGGAHLPELTYAAVLAIGLSQVSRHVQGGARQLTSYRTSLIVTLVLSVVAYAALESCLSRFVAAEDTGAPSFLVNSVAFSIFAVGLCLTQVLLAQRSALAHRLYVSLLNGNYLGSRSTRALIRVWPA